MYKLYRITPLGALYSSSRRLVKHFLQALAGPVVLPYPRKLLLAAIRTLLTTRYMEKQSGCDLSTEPMPEVLTLLHPLFNQRPNHPESGHLSHMRFYRRCSIGI